MILGLVMQGLLICVHASTLFCMSAQALDTSLQQAVQHMQQEAEKAKENASAAIQVHWGDA